MVDTLTSPFRSEIVCDRVRHDGKDGRHDRSEERVRSRRAGRVKAVHPRSAGQGRVSCSSINDGHERPLREEREEDRGIGESEGDPRERCDDPECLGTARPIK